MYLYPSKMADSSEILTSKNLRVHPRLKPLYDYLMQNHRMVDLENYHKEYLSIFSREVLKMIKDGDLKWEKMVPEMARKIIKDKKLFGYRQSSKKSAVKI